MNSPPTSKGLLDLHPPESDFLAETLQGLRQNPKELPCKYFYDARGSALFDEITRLEEYYPTRTEIGILRRAGESISRRIGPEAMVVEYGSGSGLKTHLLLDALEQPTAYVPVEISRDHLESSAAKLQAEYPHLEVLPVCADFTQELQLPRPRRPVKKTVVFFPGSTVGNFAPVEARDFLERCLRVAGPSGGLLIGVDLKKDPEILVRAYDDEAGVTAAFNLNLLRRINVELDADFDLDAFEHRATYDEAEGRIEMHLVSQREQVVSVADEEVRFARDETIHTESSYKYHVQEFVDLACDAGFELGRVWTDPDLLFSLHYYET